MNECRELPAWAAFVTAMLLLVGAAITLIGSLGLLRLKSFYERRPCADARDDARERAASRSLR